MPDPAPAPPRGKFSLIAPITIAGVVAGILLVALLGRPEKPAPTPPPAPAPAVAPPAIVAPAPIPVLTRDDLVQGADRAAAAYAIGAPVEAGKSPLVGRQFRLEIPFGCEGPQSGSSTAQAFVDYNVEKGTLRLVARPVVLTALPLVKQMSVADKVEAVEGFWIPRPWANSEACPPKRQTGVQAIPTPPAAHTLGLARFFETGGSRLQRHTERPYEFVRKIDKTDTSVLGHTYRLRVSGRLSGYGDGQAIRCWSESADHRPICLYAVAYDSVAFVDADSGEVLSEWRD